MNQSTQGQPTPAPNLNPSQATGVTLPTAPARIGALVTEQTRGTKPITFRVPNAMSTLVNRIVADDRFGFAEPSHFYLQATAYLLFLYEGAFRGDAQFERWAHDVKRLDAMLALQEPIEAFRERLSKAEEHAKAAVAAGSLDYGFQLLEEAVTFVTTQRTPLRDAVERMLRDSQPFKDLVRALLDSERYGLSDELDRLQKFMGGAL